MAPRLVLSAVILGCALSACSSGSGEVGVPASDLPAVTGGGADRIDP